MNSSAKKDLNSYYYLWHLGEIGVIDLLQSDSDIFPKVKKTLWDDIVDHPNYLSHKTKSKVALIDVGVSKTHPNLEDQIIGSLDLASNRYGVQYRKPGKTGKIPKHDAFFGKLASKAEKGKALLIRDKNKGKFALSADDDKRYYEAIIDELVDPKSKGMVLNAYDDPDENFGSHGTAIAGLIVGNSDIKSDSLRQGRLPYFGVNPFAELITVRTSFDSDPFQFLAAFLYAWSLGVDVIVLPRGIPDPKESFRDPKNYGGNSGSAREMREARNLFELIDKYKNPKEKDPKMPYEGSLHEMGWRVLKHLILAISQEIPVVCAAGNDGESQLIYPANLADGNEGNGIVSVGAVNAQGLKSGYSNYGNGLTLVAPSDDIEVYNRHQRRTSEEDADIEGQPPAGSKNRTSIEGLLTSDLPGPYGYDEGMLSRPPANPRANKGRHEGGNYTIFGGTSGACALVGGVISLMQTLCRVSGKRPMKGKDIKDILQNTADSGSLESDKMNAFDKYHKDKYFFGAGLINARSTIDRVRQVIGRSGDKGL